MPSVEKSREFEFRIGTVGHTGFNTNITKATFDLAMKRMLKFKGWETVTQTAMDCYRTDNMRMEEDDEGNRTCTRKERLVLKDFSVPGLSWGVRMACSDELPTNPVHWKETYTKNRTSFLRKNVRIDFTVITHDDIDDEDPVKRQIEVEFIPGDELENIRIVWKVFDILRILEDPFPPHEAETQWFEACLGR